MVLHKEDSCFMETLFLLNGLQTRLAMIGLQTFQKSKGIVEEVKGACQAENGFAAAEELTRIFAEADCEELTDTHMYAICGQN